MAKDWTAALQNKRNVGDTWADGLVEEIVSAGGSEYAGEASMGRLIGQIVSVHSTVPDDMPAKMKAYFNDTTRPAWVDTNQFALANELFRRNGVEICMILLCASLPACYADAAGVAALDQTHQLTKHPLRRVVETVRMVLEVLLPGTLLENGHGAVVCKKVRLLHATNRRMLRNQPEARWNEKAWGLPLNQEDLALTLMTFATVVLDSLAKLNLYVSPEEQESYMHLWRYVGYLMGVEEELLPESVADGSALYHTIADRVYASSPAGIALTTSLVKLMEDIVPGVVLDQIIPAKIRLYMGDKVADMLGVAKVSPYAITPHLLDVVKFVHGIEHTFLRDHQLFGLATDSLGRLMLHGLEDYERTDSRPQFHVPDLLREEWKMSPSKPTQAVVTGTAQPVAPATDTQIELVASVP